MAKLSRTQRYQQQRSIDDTYSGLSNPTLQSFSKRLSRFNNTNSLDIDEKLDSFYEERKQEDIIKEIEQVKNTVSDPNILNFEDQNINKFEDIEKLNINNSKEYNEYISDYISNGLFPKISIENLGFHEENDVLNLDGINEDLPEPNKNNDNISVFVNNINNWANTSEEEQTSLDVVDVIKEEDSIEDTIIEEEVKVETKEIVQESNEKDVNEVLPKDKIEDYDKEIKATAPTINKISIVDGVAAFDVDKKYDLSIGFVNIKTEDTNSDVEHLQDKHLDTSEIETETTFDVVKEDTNIIDSSIEVQQQETFEPSNILDVNEDINVEDLPIDNVDSISSNVVQQQETSKPSNDLEVQTNINENVLETSVEEDSIEQLDTISEVEEIKDTITQENQAQQEVLETSDEIIETEDILETSIEDTNIIDSSIEVQQQETFEPSNILDVNEDINVEDLPIDNVDAISSNEVQQQETFEPSNILDVNEDINVEDLPIDNVDSISSNVVQQQETSKTSNDLEVQTNINENVLETSVEDESIEQLDTISEVEEIKEAITQENQAQQEVLETSDEIIETEDILETSIEDTDTIEIDEIINEEKQKQSENIFDQLEKEFIVNKDEIQDDDLETNILNKNFIENLNDNVVEESIKELEQEIDISNTQSHIDDLNSLVSKTDSNIKEDINDDVNLTANHKININQDVVEIRNLSDIEKDLTQTMVIPSNISSKDIEVIDNQEVEDTKYSKILTAILIILVVVLVAVLGFAIYLALGLLGII